MYPDADIPVVEVSISSRLGAAFNFQLGEVLAPLREEGVLMIGSGGISHNLREIFASPRDPSGVQKVEVFTEWVADKLISGDYQSVVEYESSAPHASYNHPTTEHFYPLMTVLGASGNAKADVYTTVWNTICWRWMRIVLANGLQDNRALRRIHKM